MYINILAWLRGLQDKLLYYFSAVDFVSKSLWGIEGQKKLKKLAILT